MTRSIELTQGKVALVDDVDYERVAKIKWHAYLDDGIWYAKSGKPEINLHRFILGVTQSKTFVDHKDGDGLNCTRANLRLCSNRQNQHNARRHRKSASGFKGVSFHKRKKKWQAQICVNGIDKHLGYFSNPQDAARVYDRNALNCFGEFARTNFIP